MSTLFCLQTRLLMLLCFQGGDNLNERLLQIRKKLNLNQEDFGSRIELSKASISALETGLREITDRTVMLLCSTYNVNEDWLRNGIGEMFIENSVISLDEFAKKNNISEFETDVMKLYMTLDEKVRNEFMQGLRELALKSTTKKNLSVVKKEELPPGAPVAAHNDAPLTEEEIALMREDLENLSKI